MPKYKCEKLDFKADMKLPVNNYLCKEFCLGILTNFQSPFLHYGEICVKRYRNIEYLF